MQKRLRRAEEKMCKRKNAAAITDLDLDDPDWVQRCDEKTFMVEAFRSIKGTIIPIVETKIPMLMASLEECEDVAHWIRDALYVAGDVIEDADLIPATISAIAEGGAEAALPFLHRAIEDQLPRIRDEERQGMFESLPAETIASNSPRSLH